MPPNPFVVENADLPSWVIFCDSGRTLPKEFLLAKMWELIVANFGIDDFSTSLLEGWSKVDANKLQTVVLGMNGYA